MALSEMEDPKILGYLGDLQCTALVLSWVSRGCHFDEEQKKTKKKTLHRPLVAHEFTPLSTLPIKAKQDAKEMAIRGDSIQKIDSYKMVI